MLSKVAFSQIAFFANSSNTQFCQGRTSSVCKMEMQSKSSSVAGSKKESLTKQPQSPVHNPHLDTTNESNLQFTKLQQLDREINQESRCFGEFVAREALLDEEYWKQHLTWDREYMVRQTAAWLRAEGHWEGRPNERYANNYKRQYAEQEYNALKRRCKGYQGQQSSCIITIKKQADKNIQHTIIKSVVGTLDLSIRYLLQGESFPGERVQAPLFCNTEKREATKYCYIANLCVAKSARRKGIASNMLKFAMESAKSKGAELIYVHVHRNNTPARQLYQNLGFEIVDVASLQLQEEQTYLLCCKA